MGAPERTVSAQPFIPESALTGPEITRQLLLKEVGHAPPIEAIIAVFLAEPDPAEIASSLLSQAIAMRYDDAKQGQIRLPAVPCRTPVTRRGRRQLDSVSTVAGF